MNPNDPWALPPLPAKGTPSDYDLYWCVGRALSMWEFFEFHLAILFNLLSDQTCDSPAVRRAYGSVASFSARADLLRAAAEGYFNKFPDENLAGEVSSIINTSRRASARRNDIAHGCVLAYTQEGGRIRDFTVVPALYRSNRHDINWRPTYALTASDLRRFISKIQELIEPTRRLANKIEDRH